MRISDWSSDVCSSDLGGTAGPAADGTRFQREEGKGEGTRARRQLNGPGTGTRRSRQLQKEHAGRCSTLTATGRETSGSQRIGHRDTTERGQDRKREGMGRRCEDSASLGGRRKRKKKQK